MSNDIGGELGSMTATARRFDTAGTNFTTELNTLATKLSDAARLFIETASTALNETNTLTSNVSSEMSALKAQGDATTWRGQNKERFSSDVAAFQAKLTEATTKMQEFATNVKTQVAVPLNNQITEFGGQVKASGENAKMISSSFNTAVAAQAEALNAAMNTGWTSGS
jgi:uncharacterized protein YukE